jgi:stage II sporulation protein M
VIPDREVFPYLGILCVLFVAAFAAGVAAPAPLRQEVADAYARLVEPYREVPGGELFLLILINNVVGALFVLVAGVLLGILPVLSVGGNGFLFGALYRQAAGEGGYGAAALAALPHGVLEVAALLIAASYGMWLGSILFRRLRRAGVEPIGGKILYATRRFFAGPFPLLVVAAAIETLKAVA